MLRVFEAFAGVGSQRMALRNIGIDFEVVGISDVDRYALLAYDAIHHNGEPVEEKTKEVKESIIANQKKKTEQMKKARQKDKVATTVKASNGLTYEQINMKLTEIVNKTLLPLACDTNGDNAHIMSIEEAWEYAQKIGGPLLAKMEPLMKARKELEKKYPILTDKDADNVVVIVGPNGKRSYWSKEPLLF